MPRVWVSVGSNIDRERHIRGALDDLRGLFAKHAHAVLEEGNQR